MSEELPPNERPPAERRPPQEEIIEEKFAEKEREKIQEKSADEKPRHYEEKYRRDPISGMFWAALLIMVGVVFLAENFGVLPDNVAGRRIDPWVWILFGAGVLVLLEAAVRLASPDYRLPTTGRFIWGGILMLIAVGLAIGDFGLVWPLVLVIIGLAVLLRGIIR